MIALDLLYDVCNLAGLTRQTQSRVFEVLHPVRVERRNARFVLIFFEIHNVAFATEHTELFRLPPKFLLSMLCG